MRRTLVTIAVIGLGCGRLATEEVADPPVESPAVVESPAPEPPPAQTRASKAAPGFDLSRYPAPIRAYYADCAHSFMLPDDMSGEDVDECALVEFDQNCASDPSGCWDKGESCKEGCPGECSQCSQACMSSCDSCKGDCAAGDGPCRMECAEARSACRDECMGEKSSCFDECESDRKRCYDKFEREVSEQCPRCREMTTCIEDVFGEDGPDPWEKCGRKFKKQPQFCKEACFTF